MSKNAADTRLAAAEAAVARAAVRGREASPRLIGPPPSPVGPPLLIQSLGRFSVRGMNGAGLGDTESRTHARVLLALTASSSAGLSRDELTDALWPHHAEAAARNRLYHTMHLVRRSLGALAWPDDWIVLKQGRVQLDPRVCSDAAQLDAAASGPLHLIGDAELLAIADQCQGDWAPDVDAGGLGHVIRRRLRDCHARLLHEAAARQSNHGDTPARRAMLRRVLQLSPTDEWAYRQLMQIDLDAQRPHAVLRTFEVASRELVQQLGLRPSAALSDLASLAAARLDAGHGGGEPQAPRHKALVGREAMVRTLCAELNARAGVWNLSGLSGVGKTSLMHEVARRVGPLRADGVRFVSLGDGDNQEAVVSVVLRACRFEVDATATPADSLRKLLHTRDVLLVVDDLTLSPRWQELVGLLCGPLAARAVLVTHTPIGDASIRRLALPPLATTADDAPIAQARLSPAVALFQMRRTTADAQPLSDAQVREVVELVRRLDGLPLAIELASARTATMTPGEILRQIDHGLLPVAVQAAALRDTGLEPAPRHRSVAAALDITVNMLSLAGRRAYLCAAVFPGAFSLAQFDAVAAAASFGHELAGVPVLDELVAAGLLGGSESGALRMLHLPRAHARGLAQKEGVWPRIELARIDQVIAALEQGATHQESPGYSRWMNNVLNLHDDALSVLSTAQRDDDKRFLRLLLPLCQSWMLRVQRQVPITWFEQGLAAARRQADPHAEMLILLPLSGTLIAQKRFDEALERTELALRLAHGSKHPVAVAATVSMRGHALDVSGQTQEAIKLLKEWHSRFPAGTPGHLSLSSELICAGQQVEGVSPRDPEWTDSAALRARFAGSLAWPNLLQAVDDTDATLSPAAHLRIAEEMYICCVELHNPLHAHYAQYRKVIALLTMDLVGEAAQAAREWHRLAAGAGLELSIGLACLLLAELGWRVDDVASAGHWLDQVPALAEGQRDEEHVICSLHLARAMSAAIAGDRSGAAAHFMKLTRLTLAEVQRPTLELAVECGALVAGLHGAQALRRSLGEGLLVVAEPTDRAPITQRFRERHLGLRAGVLVHATPDEVAAASQRARDDLCALFDQITAAASA